MGKEGKYSDIAEAQVRAQRPARNARLKLGPKQAAAMDTLEDRWIKARQQIAEQGFHPITCVCKIDRIVLVTKKLNLDSLKAIPGYRPAKKARFLPAASHYKMAHKIRGTGSIREVVVEYSPRSWGMNYRVTVIPGDDGLRRKDPKAILKLMPGCRLTLAEVCWDFPLASGVDVPFLRQRILCGKMPLPDGGSVFHIKWGVPKGAMVVRAYTKFELSRTRLELQLQTRFLRKHGINSISDFHRLQELLLPGHLWFGRLDLEKLVAQLSRRGMDAKKRRQILERVADREDSLWETLRYLRGKAGLANTRRLCDRLENENSCVRNALTTLLMTWPNASAKAGRE